MNTGKHNMVLRPSGKPLSKKGVEFLELHAEMSKSVSDHTVGLIIDEAKLYEK